MLWMVNRFWKVPGEAGLAVAGDYVDAQVILVGLYKLRMHWPGTLLGIMAILLDQLLLVTACPRIMIPADNQHRNLLAPAGLLW